MLEDPQQSQKAHDTKRNTWSTCPADLNNGTIQADTTTPFLEYAHQFTRPITTLSCPPNSPGKVSHYDGTDELDDQAAYTSLPLGFIRDCTIFTDICVSPSLEQIHGSSTCQCLECHPQRDPHPLPKQRSSFHDILYPAPWYLGDRVTYDEAKDLPWDEEKDALYWRGSTTTGYSDGGVWHKQVRQRFVEVVEKRGCGLIFRREESSDNEWRPRSVFQEIYKHLFSVRFSSVGQRAQTDCWEQVNFFDIRPEEPYEETGQVGFCWISTAMHSAAVSAPSSAASI